MGPRRIAPPAPGSLAHARFASALAERSPDGLIALSTDGIVRFWNGGAETMFGYTRAEAVGRSKFDLIVPPDRIDETRQLLAETLARGVAVRESSRRRKDGGLVDVDVSTKLVRNAPGRAQLVLVCHKDVSALRAAAARERTRVLSRRLIEAQEAERRAVARELHDEIGQTLTALKINLQALPSTIDLAAQGRIGESVEMVGRLLDQVRGMSLDLRPSVLDDWGLTAAVRWYAERHSRGSALAVRLRSRLGDDRLPIDIEAGCFRIIQEAVTNAMRHAHAHTVNIDLRRQNGAIKVLVSDDGKGFDVAAARRRAASGTSLGLLGMQERAFLFGGDVHVVSAPGRGTHVRAWIPLGASP